MLVLLGQVAGKNKGQLFVQQRTSLAKLFKKNILVNDINNVTILTTKKFNELETKFDFVISDNFSSAMEKK